MIDLIKYKFNKFNPKTVNDLEHILYTHYIVVKLPIK